MMRLGRKDWLLGKRFSAADIYLFMLTTWLSESHQHPAVNSFANVNRVATKVMQRPSVCSIYESYISDIAAGNKTHPMTRLVNIEQTFLLSFLD